MIGDLDSSVLMLRASILSRRLNPLVGADKSYPLFFYQHMMCWITVTAGHIHRAEI